MTVTTRLARAGDQRAILDLAARAWQPVFTAVNETLGPELAGRLHGEDWRAHHAAEIEAILASDAGVTWVAEIEGRVMGFASAMVVDPGRRIGEISIVGVDPAAQRRGVGAALTSQAEAWLREQGMAIAFIGTGGDEGHAPARRLYETLGYQPFPVVQYYRVLDELPTDG